MFQGVSEVNHREGAGGAKEGSGDAVAANQGEHPGGARDPEQLGLYNRRPDPGEVARRGEAEDCGQEWNGQERTPERGLCKNSSG